MWLSVILFHEGLQKNNAVVIGVSHVSIGGLQHVSPKYPNAAAEFVIVLPSVLMGRFTVLVAPAGKTGTAATTNSVTHTRLGNGKSGELPRLSTCSALRPGRLMMMFAIRKCRVKDSLMILSSKYELIDDFKQLDSPFKMLVAVGNGNRFALS